VKKRAGLVQSVYSDRLESFEAKKLAELLRSDRPWVIGVGSDTVHTVAFFFFWRSALDDFLHRVAFPAMIQSDWPLTRWSVMKWIFPHRKNGSWRHQISHDVDGDPLARHCKCFFISRSSGFCSGGLSCSCLVQQLTVTAAFPA
jgi:hypothetical protein